MNKINHNNKLLSNIHSRTLTIVGLFLSSLAAFGSLPQPIESYYTVKDYGAPHFHPECLDLDQHSFVELINQVNQKTKDRAFHIEVPNARFSENVAKLRAAEFFHFFDQPKNNSSVWCKTNGSGIPLVASHTFGARSVVYYKENSEYYFLLIKDKYAPHKAYEVPGGYVQPDDQVIIETFENGIYKTDNLDYRSPEETAISEVLEETDFDLTKYGYGLEGTKTPLLIAQVYTKNSSPGQGIHKVNNNCQYLLFQVTPNKDNLKKEDLEISDVRWVSYTDIIDDQIDSPLDIHSATDVVKAIVQRVVAADKYKEARNQLELINAKIKNILSHDDINKDEINPLVKELLELESLKKNLEIKLKQSYIYSDGKYITYFTPL